MLLVSFGKAAWGSMLAVMMLMLVMIAAAAGAMSSRSKYAVTVESESTCATTSRQHRAVSGTDMFHVLLLFGFTAGSSVAVPAKDKRVIVLAGSTGATREGPWRSQHSVAPSIDTHDQQLKLCVGDGAGACHDRLLMQVVLHTAACTVHTTAYIHRFQGSARSAGGSWGVDAPRHASLLPQLTHLSAAGAGANDTPSR